MTVVRNIDDCFHRRDTTEDNSTNGNEITDRDIQHFIAQQKRFHRRVSKKDDNQSYADAKGTSILKDCYQFDTEVKKNDSDVQINRSLINDQMK